jgi:transposase-like protein
LLFQPYLHISKGKRRRGNMDKMAEIEEKHLAGGQEDASAERRVAPGGLAALSTTEAGQNRTKPDKTRTRSDPGRTGPIQDETKPDAIATPAAAARNPDTVPLPQNAASKLRMPRATPSALDWMFMRHLTIVEQAGVTEVAREYGVSPDAVRKRRLRENWNDEDNKAAMPSLEELLVMRNEREIARVLRTMEKKLVVSGSQESGAGDRNSGSGRQEEAATPQPSEAKKGAPGRAGNANDTTATGATGANKAAKPAAAQHDEDIIGKRARAVQSLARACDVAAATRRKIMTHDGPRTTLTGYRKKLGDELARVVVKFKASEIPGEPD